MSAIFISQRRADHAWADRLEPIPSRLTRPIGPTRWRVGWRWSGGGSPSAGAGRFFSETTR
jgi:hypothetical protein